MFPHQRFDFAPKVRVAFTLGMSRSEQAIVPGKGTLAVDWRLAIIEAVIAEDLGSRRIRGYDRSTAMHETVRLIKIHRLGDIRRDHGVVLPELGYAVDLYRQQNRNSNVVQVARQHDCGSASPALPEENNVRLTFLLWREISVVIAIENPKDRAICCLSPPILKNLYVGIVGISPADALRQTNRAMMRIVMAYEAADKANQNICRSLLHMCNGAGLGKQRSGSAQESKKQESGSQKR